VTAILQTSLAKLPPPIFYSAQATSTAGIASELPALHKSRTSSWHEEMPYSTTCCSHLIKVVKFGLNQAQIWRYRKILAVKCWSLGAMVNSGGLLWYSIGILWVAEKLLQVPCSLAAGNTKQTARINSAFYPQLSRVFYACALIFLTRVN